MQPTIRCCGGYSAMPTWRHCFGRWTRPFPPPLPRRHPPSLPHSQQQHRRQRPFRPASHPHPLRQTLRQQPATPLSKKNAAGGGCKIFSASTKRALRSKNAANPISQSRHSKNRLPPAQRQRRKRPCSAPPPPIQRQRPLTKQPPTRPLTRRSVTNGRFPTHPPLLSSPMPMRRPWHGIHTMRNRRGPLAAMWLYTVDCPSLAR